MDKIMVIVAWVQSNWAQIALAISSLIGFASIVVKLTPTQKDDNILAKILPFISKYIALNTTKHE